VKDLSELALLVERWAHDRNLIEGTTPDKQFIKLVEEIGEVAETLAKDKPHNFKLEMGDMLVVMTILAAQKGTNLNECLALAWNKIKDRKGRMVEGYFVKEDDL
jgi:NTP pyrophosphatase (non-canonical NTP hydrolase)